MLGDAAGGAERPRKGRPSPRRIRRREAVRHSAGVSQRAAGLDAEPEVAVDRDRRGRSFPARPEPRRHAQLLEAPGGSPAGVLSVHAGPRDPQAPCGRSVRGRRARGGRSAWTTSIDEGSAIAATPSNSGRIDSEPMSSSAIRQGRPRIGRSVESRPRMPSRRSCGMLRYSSSPPSVSLEALSELVGERVRRQNERPPRRHDASSSPQPVPPARPRAVRRRDRHGQSEPDRDGCSHAAPARAPRP